MKKLNRFFFCSRHSSTATEAPHLHMADSSDAMTLYSLDCREGPDVVKMDEDFHGYPVLKKVEIKENAQRNELLAALKDGLAHRPEIYAKCFWPRHGLRFVENKKIVEYVIYFQCENSDEFVDGERQWRGLSTINSDVRDAFDKPLNEAYVPIAPLPPH